MLAERDGHWVLARTYAEKAKSQYEELADRANVGRLLNNLGAVEFLLGKPEVGGRAPQARLRGRARDRARRGGRQGRLVARAGASPHRRHQEGRGAGASRARDHRRARGHARRGRERAARARARAARAGPPRRGRESRFAASEDAFAKLSSASHRAAAWIAQGDLATKRGDERRAAVLYRRAAEALQDFRF